jgi:hypothetical protein
MSIRQRINSVMKKLTRASSSIKGSKLKKVIVLVFFRTRGMNYRIY